MKNTIKAKLAVLSAGVMAVPALSFGVVHAIGTGQIEKGNIYYARNLTTGGAFGDPIGADKCQTLQYKVSMHNPGAAPVTNVNIKVNLPGGASTQNVSTATITAQNAFPATVSDTATVNLASALSISYVSGSTELLNSSNQVISSLPDGITSGGINVGTVGVSLNEIKNVQFKAKTECPPEQPKTPVYKCDLLDINATKDRKVTISKFETTATNGAVFKSADVSWGDNSAVENSSNIVGKSHTYGADGTYTISATAHFTVDGKDVTSNGPSCQKQVTFKPGQPPEVTPPTETPGKGPTELVNTGPGEVAGIFGAVTAAGAVTHRWMLGRRLSRQ